MLVQSRRSRELCDPRSIASHNTRVRAPRTRIFCDGLSVASHNMRVKAPRTRTLCDIPHLVAEQVGPEASRPPSEHHVTKDAGSEAPRPHPNIASQKMPVQDRGCRTFRDIRSIASHNMRVKAPRNSIFCDTTNRAT